MDTIEIHTKVSIPVPGNEGEILTKMLHMAREDPMALAATATHAIVMLTREKQRNASLEADRDRWTGVCAGSMAGILTEVQ